MSCAYYAIDFETSNDYYNSVCSLDTVRFVNGVECGSVCTLICPAKMYVKPDFTDIHRISYEDVYGKSHFPEVW